MYEQKSPSTPALQDNSLPWHLEAEQALLGALLIDNKSFQDIEDLGLTSDTFYEPVHKWLFAIMADMVSKNQLCSGVTLHTRLAEQDCLKDIGGAAYLATLIDQSCDGFAVRDYGTLLVSLALRRDLIREGEALAASARKIEAGPEGARELLDAAAGRLTALERGSDHRSQSILDAVSSAVEEALKVLRDQAPPTGHSTGLRALDAKCGLLKPGMLVTVAGRPGMGKSAVAVELAYSFSKRGIGVGYFSPEMDASEHGERIASSIAYTNHVRIPYENISIGKMSEAQLKMLSKCSLEARNLPFLVDDRGDLPFERLTGRIRALDRQMVQRYGKRLEVVIIDHLGLMQAPKGGFGSNRVQEVSLMTAGLKRIARSMGLIVIVLSQLNRAVESREDKRPLLNDLRESGSIEQDSNQVWLVYREAYYIEKQMEALYAAGKHQMEEYADLRDRRDKVKDVLEIDVAKRRGGKGGRAILACYIPYNAVRDPIGATTQEHQEMEQDAL
jgi:replicative DNA helicase